jgi:hypothetical protein
VARSNSDCGLDGCRSSLIFSTVGESGRFGVAGGSGVKVETKDVRFTLGRQVLAMDPYLSIGRLAVLHKAAGLDGHWDRTAKLISIPGSNGVYSPSHGVFAF